MKVVVLLRAVDDPTLAAGFSGTTWRLDDPSLTALALALALKADEAVSTTGLSAGPASWERPLQDAIALGVDEAVRTWCEELAGADLIAHASAIAAAIPADTALIVAGSTGTGVGSGVLAAALAEQLDWPFVDNATSVRATDRNAMIQARAPAGRRLELSAPLPCVVTCARQTPPPLMAPVRRRILAELRSVPLHPAGNLTSQGRYAFAGYGPPRPLTRRLFKPDTRASSGKRLRQLMAGGAGGAKKSLDSSGDLSAQVADLLQKEGFIA